MGGRVRQRVTSRFKPTDLFDRRLVITISRGGAALVGLGFLVGLRFAIDDLLTAVALVCGVVAVVTVLEARHQLRTFRYEVIERVTTILATYQVPEADLRIAHGLGLLDPDDPDDDAPVHAPFIRLRNRKLCRAYSAPDTKTT